MTYQERNATYLYLGLASLVCLLWLIATTAPTIPWIIVFFILAFSVLFFVVLFISRSRRQAGLISATIIMYLFLRYIDLTNPFYAILLIASVASIELSHRKR